jgi:hypothetical protein
MIYLKKNCTFTALFMKDGLWVIIAQLEKQRVPKVPLRFQKKSFSK